MKNAKKWGGLVLLAGSTWMYSCQPDTDVQVPEISSISINGVESDDHAVLAGEVVQIRVEVHDNEELKQLKVNVHPADDGHAHGSGSGSVGQPNVGNWSYSNIISVSGTHTVTDLTIPVPLNVAGEWHLEVMALDASGNEAVEKVVTISVSNNELPVIEVTSNPLAVNGVLVLNAGNPVATFVVDVTDSSGIDSLSFEAMTESGEVVFTQIFDAGDWVEFNTGSIEVSFPGSGLYDVKVTALDINGFENLWIQEVEVQ